MNSEQENGLSSRGQDLKASGSIRSHFASIWANEYHAESNPSGIVNLGTAENYVMMGDIAKFVNENVHFKGPDLDYGSGPWGSLRLRKAMANYMDKYFKPLNPINPDDILFAAGCTSLFEMLGFTIFEPGDGLLLSRPIYQAFKRDFSIRAQVKSIFASFHGVDQFTKEAVSSYESAIIEAQKAGTKVRALLICNPHNPLGRCYDPEALIDYMKLCKKYSLHLIVDEIYALSVYKTTEPNSTPFKSVLAIDSSKYLDPNYLHVLYGFSKDMASGGLRLGCIWTRNSDLITALSSISLMNWPSNLAETIAIQILENDKWVESYLKTNQTRLGERATLARSVLEEYDIAYTKGACAGFFLWLDLRKYLGQGDPEKATLKSERLFKKNMLAKGVYLTSGEGLTSEYPGFFRLCFVKDEAEVREGLKRLKEALEEFKPDENVSEGADPIW